MGSQRSTANHPLVHRPLWLTIGWGLVLLVIYLSLAPATELPEVRYDDKFGHLLAYFTLMAWFAQLYTRSAPLVLALLTLGASLEIVQGVSGYRDMAAADMLANAAGVGLGWLATRHLPNMLAQLERIMRERKRWIHY